MASIRKRTLKSGETRYTAQIIRRNHDLFESETFNTRTKAKRWAENREEEIDRQIAAGQAPRTRKMMKVTLGDAIGKYIEDNRKDMGRTKEQVLNTILTEYDLPDMRCDMIESRHVVEFVQELHERPELNSPSTAGNYLSHLAAIFEIARPMWGFDLDEQAMKDAQKVCKRMGLIGKSKKRDRRPTMDELNAFMALFERKSRHRPKSIPMHRVLAFAIFSTRREDEICRITWDDYEPEHKRVMVRAMKHPGDKEANDTWTELPDPACAIIDAMPRVSDRIFPYNHKSVGAAFTRAHKHLEIKDLRFHDMRHEGTSRLFEMGYNIPQAAGVTGHRSWTSLKRYNQMKERGDRFDGWEWIDVVTRPVDVEPTPAAPAPSNVVSFPRG